MILYRLESDIKYKLALKEKCKSCDGNVLQSYMPMPEWDIQGPLCGACYSKKIYDHYPGDHVRVDTSEKTT